MIDTIFVIAFLVFLAVIFANGKRGGDINDVANGYYDGGDLTDEEYEQRLAEQEANRESFDRYPSNFTDDWSKK